MNDKTLVMNGVYLRLKRAEVWKRNILLCHFIDLLWDEAPKR